MSEPTNQPKLSKPPAGAFLTDKQVFYGGASQLAQSYIALRNFLCGDPLPLLIQLEERTAQLVIDYFRQHVDGYDVVFDSAQKGDWKP